MASHPQWISFILWIALICYHNRICHWNESEQEQILGTWVPVLFWIIKICQSEGKPSTPHRSFLLSKCGVFLIQNQVSWLKWYCLSLVFGRCPFWIWAGAPSDLTEVFVVFMRQMLVQSVSCGHSHLPLSSNNYILYGLSNRWCHSV